MKDTKQKYTITERALRMTTAVLTTAALVAGTFAALPLAAQADGSTPEAAPVFSVVGAEPTTGTLGVNSQLQVYFREANGETDVTPGPGCQVNGIDLTNFQNLTGGLYSADYTVSASDTARAAGDVPINCELSSTGGSTDVTAWTDGNTVAVDPTLNANTGNSGNSGNGGNTGNSGNTGVEAAPSVTVSAVPSSGTLTAGQTLTVYLQEASNENDLSLVGNAMINGVNVGSLQNDSGGLYQLNYTVGANDADRTSGQIPVSFELANGAGATTTVSAFTDNNTVAINTDSNSGNTGNTGNTGNSGGTATSTAPALGSVGITPTSGTLTAGATVQVFINEVHGINDLTLSGPCLVNGVNVNSSFQNDTNGLYQLTYTVGASDADRTAGNIPINCSLSDAAGSITATVTTDGNTVAINADGNLNAAPSVTVSAVPSTGTLTAGQSLTIYLQDSRNENDLSLVGNAMVNGVNVGALQNDSNGLYQLTYTVGANDTDRTAGSIPVSLELSNSSGATSNVTAWTDSNTVAINADGNLGSSGSTSGGTTGTIGGTVNSPEGTLAVTSIDQVQGSAIADGSFADGWVWVFHVTVPSNETSFSMKFGDWTNGTGGTIAAANNMRISTDQSASTSPVMITGADTFTVPVTLNSDEDATTTGRQIDVRVEMAVPAGTANGSYTTSYGVQSN